MRVPASILVAAWLTPLVAGANPLALTRFGGLRGDPVYEGAYATFWNPAALPGRGLSIGLHGVALARQASYQRDAARNDVTPDEAAANAGEATLSSLRVVPALAGTFGIPTGDLELGAGAMLFFEGGGARWNPNPRAPSRYPGAVDGPQRWAVISSRFLLANVAAGFAVRHAPTGLSVGAGPLLTHGRFATSRARNLDGSDDLVDAAGRLKEGRAFFEGTDRALRVNAGVRWDVGDHAVAVTWCSGATLALDGEAALVFGAQAPSREPAVLELPLADTLRVGAGLRVGPGVTVRPSFEWSRWSDLERTVVRARDDGAVLVDTERAWRDGLGGRLRGDLALSESLAVSLGAGFERGVSPSRSHDAGLSEADSVEVGAGASLDVGPHLRVTASLVWQHFLEREITDSVQEPRANGTYTDQRQFVTIDLELRGWAP